MKSQTRSFNANVSSSTWPPPITTKQSVLTTFGLRCLTHNSSTSWQTQLMATLFWRELRLKVTNLCNRPFNSCKFLRKSRLTSTLCDCLISSLRVQRASMRTSWTSNALKCLILCWLRSSVFNKFRKNKSRSLRTIRIQMLTLHKWRWRRTLGRTGLRYQWFRYHGPTRLTKWTNSLE